MKNVLIVWMVLSLLEVVRHWYIIKRKKKSPNKLVSFLARAAVAICLAWFDELPLSITLPTYAIVDWCFHDYVLNLLCGTSPIWYLNDTGSFDRFQRNYPNMFVWFAWKVIFFIGLVGAYFFNF
jgi:hypothetical protein